MLYISLSILIFIICGTKFINYYHNYFYIYKNLDDFEKIKYFSNNLFMLLFTKNKNLRLLLLEYILTPLIKINYMFISSLIALSHSLRDNDVINILHENSKDLKEDVDVFMSMINLDINKKNNQIINDDNINVDSVNVDSVADSVTDNVFIKKMDNNMTNDIINDSIINNIITNDKTDDVNDSIEDYIIDNNTYVEEKDTINDIPECIISNKDVFEKVVEQHSIINNDNTDVIETVEMNEIEFGDFLNEYKQEEKTIINEEKSIKTDRVIRIGKKRNK